MTKSLRWSFWRKLNTLLGIKIVRKRSWRWIAHTLRKHTSNSKSPFTGTHKSEEIEADLKDIEKRIRGRDE